MGILKFLAILGFFILAYVLIAGIHMRTLISKGKAAAEKTAHFRRERPGAPLRILIVGDSTAQGTGAMKPEESVAGRFGAKYPNAEIINRGFNGKRVATLAKELQEMRSGGFDFVLIMIGGNDITHLTPLEEVEKNARISMQEAKRLGKHVAIVHSGNLGASPLFPWPIDTILTARTRRLRDLYIRLAREENITYVDLFAEKIDDIFLTDIPRYYLKDQFHPSGDGYAIWFEKIQDAMTRDGIVLK